MVKRVGSDFTKTGKRVALYEVPCPSCNRTRVIKRKDHAVRHLDKICKYCSSRNNHPQGEYRGFRVSWWNKYRLSAIARNLSWEITIDDGVNLFESQNGKCALTGLILTCSGDFNDITASLDRVDNSKGYTIDNIQFVHKDVNMMRGTLSLDRLIELCNLISNKVKW